MRKAQLTLFVIIGIVLVVAIGIMLFLQRPVERPPLPTDFAPVTSTIKGCLESAFADALASVAAAGGHIVPPADAITLSRGDFITIGRDGQTTTLPTLDAIASDVGFSTSLAIERCLDASGLQQQGFTIQNAPASVTVRFDDKASTAQLRWPLQVTKGSVTATMDDVIATRTFPMKALHADALIAADAITDKGIDLDRFIDLGSAVTYITHDEDTLLFSIKRGDDLFAFAAVLRRNHPPYAPSLDPITLRVGETRTLAVDASDPDGDTLSYSDDSWMFDIGNDGKAIIEATETGTFDFTITISDDKGGSWKLPVTIIVP